MDELKNQHNDQALDDVKAGQLMFSAVFFDFHLNYPEISQNKKSFF